MQEPFDDSVPVPLTDAAFLQQATFGGGSFSAEEEAQIQQALEQNISADLVRFRPGPSGSACRRRAPILLSIPGNFSVSRFPFFLVALFAFIYFQN